LASPDSQPVTAATLARHLGLSPSTVSIVLRGQAERRKIAPQTAERVREAARRLNYVPNQMARSLRQQRSDTIGVILADFRWEFAQAIMDGMWGILEAAGYTPFVAIHLFTAERARKELLSCLLRRDQGIICYPAPVDKSLYAPALRQDVPLILLGDRPEDATEFNFVGWDSGTATRLALEHLIRSGRRRIAFLGPDHGTQMTRTIYRTYRKVLHEAGLPLRNEWTAQANIGWSVPQMLDWSLDRIFAPRREPPDAIFAMNDGLAVPTLDALAERGLRVPEDVAIIGLGDVPMAGHSCIGLSTVRVPFEELGYQAAKLMIDLIAARRKTPVELLVTGAQLCVRNTT
jgi:LacI family transcriptional regulator